MPSCCKRGCCAKRELKASKEDQDKILLVVGGWADEKSSVSVTPGSKGSQSFAHTLRARVIPTRSAASCQFMFKASEFLDRQPRMKSMFATILLLSSAILYDMVLKCLNLTYLKLIWNGGSVGSHKRSKRTPRCA